MKDCYTKLLGKGYVKLELLAGYDTLTLSRAFVSRGTEETGLDSQSILSKLTRLMKLGHWTPFEFNFVTFKIYIPIYASNQWKRHRTWVYSERSMRYCEAESDCICELDAENNPPRGVDKEQVEQCVEIERLHNKSAMDTYKELRRKGVPKEQARRVLPQSMMTTYYAASNLRNVFHFLSLRLDKPAQYEIRLYANAMAHLLAERLPITMEAWLSLNPKLKEEYDSFEEEKYL